MPLRKVSFPGEYTRSTDLLREFDGAQTYDGRSSAVFELEEDPITENQRPSRAESVTSVSSETSVVGPHEKKGTKREKKRERKRERKEERSLRRATAQFGVITKGECQLWVSAIKASIRGVSKSPSSPFSPNSPKDDESALGRKQSLVIKSPSHGNMPATLRNVHMRTKKAAVDFGTASSVAAVRSESTTSMPGCVAEDDKASSTAPTIGDVPRAAGLLQLPQTGPKYMVHDVDGEMVVYREVSERGVPTSEERADAASLYNSSIIASALVGFGTAVVLNWLGLGSPIQFFVGLAFAFFALYLRVDSLEMRSEEESHFMTTQIVRGSPTSIFNTIMSEDARPFWDVATSSHTVLEQRDEHCDIVHVIQRPVWLSVMCLWSKPRELVLLRYWRRESDGTYYIFHQSTDHRDAPRSNNYIRGNVSSSAWVIAPPTDFGTGYRLTSKVTFMIQYQAGGIAHWLNKLGGFDDAFSLPFLKSAVCLADALKAKDYELPGISTEDDVLESGTSPLPSAGTTVRPSTARSRRQSITNLQDYEVNYDGIITGIETRTVSAVPESFAEVDASNFKVRGPDYALDKVKVPAGPAGFHLVAFDVYGFEVPEERLNIGARKGSFAWRYKDSPDASSRRFTYIINLMLPSNDNIAAVLCYQPEDPNWQTSDTMCYKMFRKFIDGDNDFQKTRFKMIPRIVEGNFIIRKTVPSKPALVANKGLTVPFHRANHYFEVDVDITSDSTARFITKMCLGASKSIVVDIAFLVEGHDDDELPEQIDGVIRFNRLDLKKHRKIRAGESLGYTPSVSSKVDSSKPKIIGDTATSRVSKHVSLARKRGGTVPPRLLGKLAEE